MRERWHTAALLALLAMMFGYVLGHSGILPSVQAQGEGGGGRIICIVGSAGGRQSNYAPIIVVDTLERSLVVYDYNYTSRNVYLKAARSYEYDTQLIDYNAEGAERRSVREVKEYVEKQRRP